MEGISNGYLYFYRAKSSYAWHKGMKQAFSVCKKNNLKAEWISRDELKEMTLPSNELVLVLPEFLPECLNDINEAFRVVGPHCLMECLTRKIPIPNNSSPVLFLGMHEVVATSTKMSKAKKMDIEKLIKYMGGFYSDVLSSHVTHLIAERAVQSEKLSVALDKGITIVQPSWVYDAWDRGPEGGDSKTTVDKHKLDAFTGLDITISGLKQADRKHCADIIVAHGGKYNPNLVQNETDIVVTNESALGGAKVKSAMAWKVPCVTSAWLEAGAAIGYPVSTAKYLITARQRPTCSTPTKGDAPSFIGSEDLSVVHGGSEHGMVNDTVNSVTSNSRFAVGTPISAIPQPVPVSSQTPCTAALQAGSEYMMWMNELSQTELQKAGQFLDGCTIYIKGFREKEKLIRILVKAGATVLETLSDRISHAIVSDLACASSLGPTSASCVNLGWVAASMKEGRAVKVDKFVFVQDAMSVSGGTASKRVPPSPLSSKGLELLKSKKTSSSDASTSEDGQRPIGSSPFVSAAPVTRKLFTTPIQSKERQTETEETEVTVDGESTFATSTLFQGFVFAVVGFDDESQAANAEVLDACGGTVVSPGQTDKIIEYAVVPVEGTDIQVSASQIVTILWIDDCKDAGKIVDVLYYHKPMAGNDPNCLSGCSICLTGFSGRERLFLATVASAYGAIVQDAFSRRDMPKKGVVKSTHLIASTASGQKYEAAKNWGIPAVSFRWLLDAVQSCGLPPESRYSLDSSEDETIIAPPSEPAKLNQIGTVLGQSTSVVQTTPAPKKPDFLKPQTTSDELPTSQANDKNSDVNDPLFPAPVSLKRNSPSGPSDEATASKFPRKDGGSGITSLKTIFQNRGSLNVTPNNQPNLNSSTSSPVTPHTPDTPYGACFNPNPSPSTRKQWKKYIDNFPCLTPDPPIPPRRKSTPLSVLKLQLRAKVGESVEGIESNTGRILKDGPYSEWAKDSPAQDLEQNLDVTPTATNQPQVVTKGSSKAVNELLNLMSDFKRNSDIDEGAGGDAAGDIDELALRLRQQPSEAADNGDHPLNKLRPNSETEFEAELPAGDYSDSEEVATCPPANPPLVSDTSSCAPKSTLPSTSCTRDGETQPINHGEDSVKSVYSNKTFVLSNLPVGTKEKYVGIIAGLGARAGTAGIYEQGTTHLIIERPLRNEKLLCAIAAGNWVLHHSYIDMCYESRCFLDEEDFEFGNSRSECRLPRLEPGTQADLAAAACRWRKRVAALGQKAFRQLIVALFVRDISAPMFTRLLCAGDATIVSNPLEANLVLLEEGKVSLPEQLQELAKKRIPVVPPVYLSLFITKFPRINPFDHLISAYPNST